VQIRYIRLQLFVLKIIYSSFESSKWQVKNGALEVLNYCAFKHSKMINYYIPEIIDHLIVLSNEIKKEIKLNVKICFESVTKTITNVDILPLIQPVIAAYMNPVAETQNALDKLVSTPFVNDIDLQTLGFLSPLLLKSMRTRKMVYQRRAAVVIETLCKLIKDPLYAKIFYPKLAPELERYKEEIAEVEIRNVCANSLDILNKVYEQGNSKLLEQFTFEKCQEIYKTHCNNHYVDFNNELVQYSCKLSFILAKKEILEQKLPFLVHRKLPNGDSEYWSATELSIMW
jgi:elongation factor 3